MHHMNVWAFDLVIRQPTAHFRVLRYRDQMCHFPSFLVRELVPYSFTLLLSHCFQYLVSLLPTSVSPVLSCQFPSVCPSLPVVVPC